MRLLLDTHVFLWWVAGSPRLSRRARKTIADAELVCVSAVTAAEIGIKIAVGKLQFSSAILAAIQSAGFADLPFTVNHAERLPELPLLHRDPFDRMLLVQAQAEGLTVLTADALLRNYGVPLIEI